MRANGFTFAVRIGREIDFFYGFGSLLQLGNELLLALDDFIMWFETVRDIDREVLFLGDP